MLLTGGGSSHSSNCCDGGCPRDVCLVYRLVASGRILYHNAALSLPAGGLTRASELLYGTGKPLRSAGASGFKSGRRCVRFGSALWLAFYALSVPFSSSRSGWLGLASWVGVLGLLWLFSDRRWKGIWDWAKQRACWVILGGTAGVGAGLYILYRFFVVFMAHPSHGNLSNPFAGRASFWISALEIWQGQPITGAGLSRFMYEYLRVTDGFPPGFWASHAHNFPFTWLAETGLLGAAALIGLVLVGGSGAGTLLHPQPTK